MTGSLENFRINAERGFDVIGFKEGRRRQAEQMAPGDEIVFYVTGVQEFGGIARVTSAMYEDPTPVWPGTKAAQKMKKHPEPYPWRVAAEPVVVLEEEDVAGAGELGGELARAGEWPAERGPRPFRGRLPAAPDHGGGRLRGRLGAPPPPRPCARSEKASLSGPPRPGGRASRCGDGSASR